MRHRVKKRHFNVDTSQRHAMIRNLVRGFLEHGRMVSTRARIKETQRWVDKLIVKAKQADLQSRRVLHSFFGKRDIVNTLVDRVVPVVKDRQSGFTRMKSLGKRRGDNVEVFSLEFVDEDLQFGTFKNLTLSENVEPSKSVLKTAKKTAKRKVGKKKVRAVPQKKSLQQLDEKKEAPAK